ncbi:MAG TPA: plasmid pRiA4b ORF-3 family protein [Dyella sp.]|uniref:plasmid pRiA4b ORF-3 family protein n=1 Tax=Dyella sp. TaxID=1869338 RepID=UPI002CD01637|nr:plasmid pRiA4b ORF-3 family protein [Dyella sp.]HTV87362.1 plasmid pRiA4b ORF-3 family protein [Dyella sp.]
MTLELQTQAFRLRIELDRTEPLVWRRIEILTSATFWDLHVAIQDAFGWMDCHLHQFEVESPTGSIHIGVPDEYAREPILEGWTVSLSRYLGQVRTLTYLYDFGDDWRHTIHLEEVMDADGENYPRCLAGENATPPEDCGGVYGYEELKQVLIGPKNARYKEMRSWLKEGHAKAYWPFDPNDFEVSDVQFTNAKLRLKRYLKNT